MNTRVDELLTKYWEGETSLDEEKELRTLIFKINGYEKEKELFAALGQFKSLEPKNLTTPQVKTRKLNPPWILWAASVTLILGGYWCWTGYEQKQAEEAAYTEVMQAFAMIQTNLAKGQQQMQPLKEFKHLNTTNQLFQLSQKTER
jgi:hypothetical protein